MSSTNSSMHEKALFEQGLGCVTWWGFSPADGMKTAADPQDILILGAGDARHFISALTDLNEGDREMKFYVYEQNLMLYARQILLISILEEGKDPKVFLEIYGNINLSPKTAQILAQLSKKILDKKIFSAEDYLTHVDLSKLKSKEKDVLAEIFKLWSKVKQENEEDQIDVDMNGFWDARLRQLMTERYDARDGIFEMDYQLRFVDRGGANIAHKEYCDWRSSGTAFVFDREDDEKLYPNLTLMSSITTRDPKTNKKSLQKGYWGDIVTGPFISFEFEPSNEVQITKSKLERTTQLRMTDYLKRVGEKVKTLSNRPKLTFLSVFGGEKSVMESDKYHGKFDRIFVSCALTHLLTANMSKNLKGVKGASSIYVETPLYLLHIAKEVLAKYREHLMKTAADCELTIDNFTDYNPAKTSVVMLSK